VLREIQFLGSCHCTIQVQYVVYCCILFHTKDAM